jgi:hypothetical protein
MTEAVAERVRRYILDGADPDLRRLSSMAEFSAEMPARRSAGSARGRAGLPGVPQRRPGWRQAVRVLHRRRAAGHPASPGGVSRVRPARRDTTQCSVV